MISGQLHKKARLEVLLDDGYWPAFSTIKAPSIHAHWQYIGEAFVKELDFGRVWLRLNENAEGDSDDIIAEWKGGAKTFLEETLVRVLLVMGVSVADNSLIGSPFHLHAHQSRRKEFHRGYRGSLCSSTS